jgi:DNA-directed RNA polymerase specialized sigma24 family protein
VTSIGTGRATVEGRPFEEWYLSAEPRLRRALVAALGPERGREAAAEALAWGWEHHERLGAMDHPVAFLFRVGQSRARPRRLRVLHARVEWSEPWVEPDLGRALRSLSDRQRVAVVLVHGYAWTMGEVADLLGVKVTTVQSHLDRGLARLRSLLEVNADG